MPVCLEELTQADNLQSASTAEIMPFALNIHLSQPPPVGRYPFKVDSTRFTADNYVFEQEDMSLEIIPAPSDIDWPTPAAIQYGTPLTADQLNAMSSVAGTFAYSPVDGELLGAGTHTLTATFTPIDPNYLLATSTVELLVKPATPILNWPTPGPITYGQPLSEAQLNATSNVDGSFAYAHQIGTVLNAGTTELQAYFIPADEANYNPSEVLTHMLLVKPAVLKICGGSPSLLYGNTHSSTTGTITGFVNGDTAAVVTDTAAPTTVSVFGRDEDGHWVGDDGYKVPKNFDEFMEERPNYIQDYARRYCMHMQHGELAEDLTQKLNTHMLSIPAVSIFRDAGCTDRIQMFDPYRVVNSDVPMKARFEAFLSQCMKNYSHSDQKKRKSDPINWDNLIGGGAEDGENVLAEDDAMYIRANDAYRRSCSREMETHILISEFLAFVKKHDPQLVDVLYAIATEAKLVDAQTLTGLSTSAFNRARTRLATLRECFENPKKRVPRWKLFSGGSAPDNGEKELSGGAQ